MLVDQLVSPRVRGVSLISTFVQPGPEISQRFQSLRTLVLDGFKPSLYNLKLDFFICGFGLHVLNAGIGE